MGLIKKMMDRRRKAIIEAKENATNKIVKPYFKQNGYDTYYYLKHCWVHESKIKSKGLRIIVTIFGLILLISGIISLFLFIFSFMK